MVEVYPQYDGPGQITALLAANVAHEFLSLIALLKRGGRPITPHEAMTVSPQEL